MNKYIAAMNINDSRQIRLFEIYHRYYACKHYETFQCFECGYKQILEQFRKYGGKE
jgi:hypothetical protein